MDSHHPIWESSRRPLHPKCVWIESFGRSGGINGGHRHFIFDYNLSNSERLRSEAPSLNGSFHPCLNLGNMRSFDQLNNKMSSLSIIGSSDRMKNERELNSLDSRSEVSDFSIEKEMFTSLDSRNVEGPVLELIDIPKEVPTTASLKRITNEIDSSKNLLAERVLQWLDLAGGRSHMSTKRINHIGKLLNATKHRSVTAKESRKITTETDDDGHKAKGTRQESVRQLSMTFNNEPIKEIQNQNIVSLSFIDLFPTTYKCSRKFLSLRRPKNISDCMEPLDLQSSLPIKPAKKSSKHFGKLKPRRLEYFDDQYRSIIQRQILETSCNTQAVKRQLHIFMPNLPKRCLLSNETDQMAKSPKSARDSESCFSCRIAST